MGWTIRIGILLLLLFSIESALAAEFGCEIRASSSCLSNQTLLIRLNSSESGAAPNNSHAQLANYTGDLYDYSVCCWTDSFRTLDNACSATATSVLNLYDTTNSHVETGSLSNYPWEACYNVTSGNISCEYVDDACSTGYVPVVSIASSELAAGNITNAHVGEFDLYKRKVCCQIGGQNPPVTLVANLTSINTTTAYDLRCQDVDTSDEDGDAVTLHYNWFRNGTSVTLLNLPMDFNGSHTYDISGYARHGIPGLVDPGDDPVFLPTGGHIGGTFDFDGINDSIEGTIVGSVFNDTYSISLWVQTDGDGDSSQTIFANDVGGSNSCPRISHQSGGTAIVINAQAGSALTATSLDLSSWTHVVYTNNRATNAGTLYINGAMVDSDGALNCTQNPNNRYVIGKSPYVLHDFDFNGSIDEVIVFNRSLAASEVQTLYELDNKFLNASELVRNDEWNCSITPVDATGLNGTTVRSNATFVQGSPPFSVTLIYPVDGNESVFERTVNFNWTDAEERDGDTVTYQFNLSVEPGTCSVQTETEGISDSNYTYGVLCIDQRYWWNVTACDDQDGCSSTSDFFNFTIASVIDLIFNVSTAQLGALQRLETVATDVNDSTEAFQLQNIGNVQVNISIVANNSPFSSTALPNESYQFKASVNESGAFNSTGSTTTYTQFTTSYQHLVKQLNYTYGMNLVRIDLNVTAPQNEPPGNKQGNVTVQGVSVE